MSNDTAAYERKQDERNGRDGRVPDWFAKLVIGCLATIGSALGGWSTYTTNQLQLKEAELRATVNANASHQSIINAQIQEKLRDIREEQRRQAEQIYRVAEAVGARKQP
jgi:hypothetical protein